MAKYEIIPWLNTKLFSWFPEIYRHKNEIHMCKEIHLMEILITTKFNWGI